DVIEITNRDFDAHGIDGEKPGYADRAHQRSKQGINGDDSGKSPPELRTGPRLARYGLALRVHWFFPIPEMLDTVGRLKIARARSQHSPAAARCASRIAPCAAPSPSDAETRPADRNAARTPSTRAAPSATYSEMFPVRASHAAIASRTSAAGAVPTMYEMGRPNTMPSSITPTAKRPWSSQPSAARPEPRPKPARRSVTANAPTGGPSATNTATMPTKRPT